MWGIVGGSVIITMADYLFVCMWDIYSGGGSVIITTAKFLQGMHKQSREKKQG